MRQFPKLLFLMCGAWLAPVPGTATEMISLNFWAGGGGVPNSTWEDYLTLDPADLAGAGDFATDGWQNYVVPWSPSSPQAPVTLTGTEGSTVSFTLNDARNGGPYLRRTPRSTLVNDPNGNLMDGHANATEDPGDGSNFFDFSFTEPPFEAYDLVIYLGANQAQFGSGDTAGKGKISLNGGPFEEFTLTSGAFDGNFTEITDPDTPGNFLVYRGLTGPCSGQIAGLGFNHLGPTGLQIVESAEARQPLEITGATLDPTSGEITLTWKSNPGDVYGIYYAEDLASFTPGINPAIEANAEGRFTSFGPFANPRPDAGRLFFRIGPPDLRDPTLDRVWGNGRTVSLDFSEGMREAAATNPAHFTLTTSTGGPVAIESVAMGATPDTVVLTTATSLDLDTDFSLTVTNLTDAAGRPLTGPNTADFRTWDDDPDGIKVFILAGQSNMQGHGRNEEGNGGVTGAIGSLRYEVETNPAQYGRLVKADGDFIPRDDVKVFYNRNDLTQGPNLKKGQLLPEFGVDDARFGPEFGFGWEIGEFFDEPVLIIKTCWGGKSLFADFRSPTAVAKRGGRVGDYYVGIFDYSHAVLDRLSEEFPEFAGQGYQIAGFGWHQGWNDGGNDFTASQYEENLADLIRDIRSEFGRPELPVSIANTGIGGDSASGPRLTLLQGQLAVADPEHYPEFAGNVAAVDTRPFWEESNVSPRDQGFHWNQNGKSYYLIGEAMGQKMIDLLAP